MGTTMTYPIMASEVERNLGAQPSSYETRRREHLSAMRERVPAHLERIGWPQERLQEEREARLRGLIQVARERSTWHRERLGHLNLDELREEDLSSIPVMTKNDLMFNYDQIVTEPGITLDLIEAHLANLTSDAYLNDRFHAIASGGSSGLRGVYVYDWESWADMWLSLMRHTIRARMNSPEPPTRPLRMATVGAKHPTHASVALPSTFSDPDAMVAIGIPVTLPMTEIVARLNEAELDGLVIYPSVLPELCHEAKAERLRIAPRFINTVSEPLLPEIRAITEETWGVTVTNWWASSEGGGMGIGCGHGPYMHLTDDVLIIEPVDAQGQSVPPGVLSDKIYLTNLFNPLLPLIRFEITDQIVMIEETEPCRCGSTHRRIEDVHGRLDDLFFYPGVGSVHPHIFRSRLGRNRGIVEYQVRQTLRGAEIAVCCRDSVDLQQLRADISDDLRSLGLSEPEIAISLVDDLERQSTGKLKRFVPLEEVKK